MRIFVRHSVPQAKPNRGWCEAVRKPRATYRRRVPLKPVVRTNRTETDHHVRHAKRRLTKNWRTACDTESPESTTRPNVHHEAQRQGRHVHGGHAEHLEQEQREGDAAQAARARSLYPAPGGYHLVHRPYQCLCLPFLALLVAGWAGAAQAEEIACSSSSKSSCGERSAEASWAPRRSHMRSAIDSELDEFDAA